MAAIEGEYPEVWADGYARADSKANRNALEMAYSNLTPDKNTDREWERRKDLHDWLKNL